MQRFYKSIACMKKLRDCIDFYCMDSIKIFILHLKDYISIYLETVKGFQFLIEKFLRNESYRSFQNKKWRILCVLNGTEYLAEC